MLINKNGNRSRNRPKHIKVMLVCPGVVPNALALSKSVAPLAPSKSEFTRRPTRAAANVAASAMANSVRVAVAQMTSVNDLAANFATCSRLVKEASAAGAKLLCFPESFSFIGIGQGDSLKIAEPLDGPVMQGYCSLARQVTLSVSNYFHNATFFMCPLVCGLLRIQLSNLVLCSYGV
ncbi:hypothetical protein V2J09_001354 [Rumex salicifolius]